MGPSGLQADITLPHEQEFELYHNAFSLCSMKVRFCLAELGIPYKSHHIDLIETGAYENIRKSFARINPGKTVPLLVHNGHPVYESHEQIRYAAAQAAAQSTALVPESPELVEQMEHWVDLSSLTDDPLNNSHLSAGNAVPGQTLPLFVAMIEKIPYRNIAEGFLFHFDKRRPLMFTLMKLRGFKALQAIPVLHQAMERSRSDMHRHFDTLEEQLMDSGGPWILGEPFTLADVSWMVIFERLNQADSLELFASREQRPACVSYWDGVKARPSYDQAIVRHEHPIVTYGTQRIREQKQSEPTLRKLLEGN